MNEAPKHDPIATRVASDRESERQLDDRDRGGSPEMGAYPSGRITNVDGIGERWTTYPRAER